MTANRRSGRAHAVAWLVVLAGVGCTSSSSPRSCEDLQQAARATVEQAITSHLACTNDSDCAVATFAASCFHACARAVAATGTAAVQAAIDDVDANQCKAASEQGCAVTIPPCGPMRRITCAAGVCQ